MFGETLLQCLRPKKQCVRLYNSQGQSVKSRVRFVADLFTCVCGWLLCLHVFIDDCDDAVLTEKV